MPIVPTIAAALLRVTVESSTPMHDTVDSGIRKQVFAANTSSSAFGAETTVSEQRRDGVEAPGGDAGDRRRDRRQEDRERRVGDRGEGLGREHLAAVDRAGEDRLQRAVAVLVGDDVAGDERRDQRGRKNGPGT